MWTLGPTLRLSCRCVLHASLSPNAHLESSLPFLDLARYVDAPRDRVTLLLTMKEQPVDEGVRSVSRDATVRVADKRKRKSVRADPYGEVSDATVIKYLQGPGCVAMPVLVSATSGLYDYSRNGTRVLRQSAKGAPLKSTGAQEHQKERCSRHRGG
jgi:hypothetical protein